MPSFHTLDNFDVSGLRTLVRVDLNVPMKDGRVTDATRVVRASTTLKELSEKGAKVIVLSHFGRPKPGDSSGHSEFSLQPLAAALTQALGGKPVAFANDCIGPVAEAAVAALKDGDVLLLENTRFHPGEETNSPAFVSALSKLGDVFVNDGFSVSHRAHATTVGLAEALPAVAGRLMEAELVALDNALGADAEGSIGALVGGSKVSTKLDILTNLVTHVQALVIGGAMANTFLMARGVNVGKSLAERDLLDTARGIEAAAQKAGCTLVLPVDAVVADKLEAGAPSKVVAIDAVPADAMILDIGPASVAAARKELEKVARLVWNGPVGAFEFPPFDQGTVALAKAAAELTDQGKLVSVAGGGDTVAALAHAGVLERFSYVSTAGGAFLEWLEGRELPGVAALEAAAKRLV